MKMLYYISGPQRNMQPGYWLYDYLLADGYSIKSFYNRRDDTDKPGVLKKYFRLLRICYCVLVNAQKEDMILVYDHDHSGYFLGFFASIFRPKFKILKINQMGGNLDRLFSPFLGFIARRGFKNIYTSCNNQAIANIFSNELHITSSHFVTIPDSISDFGDEIKAITDKQDKGYIFMGGSTHRDYNLFVECARQLPQYNFLAVTFHKYKDAFVNAPQNVEVIFGLPEKEFYEVMAHSSVVFVPLTNNLQGGQMVLFQGALLGKPIVTTINEAISTYFDKDSVSLINIGDTDSAVRELKKLMKSEHLRKKRGLAAANQIAQFTTERIYKLYKERLFPLSNQI